MTDKRIEERIEVRQIDNETFEVWHTRAGVIAEGIGTKQEAVEKARSANDRDLEVWYVPSCDELDLADLLHRH